MSHHTHTCQCHESETRMRQRHLLFLAEKLHALTAHGTRNWPELCRMVASDIRLEEGDDSPMAVAIDRMARDLEAWTALSRNIVDRVGHVLGIDVESIVETEVSHRQGW